MSLLEILIIVVIHWFADFVLQSDRQAKGKSKNWEPLLSHTIVYSLVWFLVGNTLISVGYLSVSFFLFAPVTFIFHTITDYFTSRLNSKLWAKGDVHNFFVSVGFDQVLHYVQLFGTYFILRSWSI